MQARRLSPTSSPPAALVGRTSRESGHASRTRPTCATRALTTSRDLFLAWRDEERAKRQAPLGAGLASPKAELGAGPQRVGGRLRDRTLL